MVSGLERRLQAQLKEHGGCLLWQGATTTRGYPVIWHNRTQYVRRVAYERANGPIAAGNEVYTVCDERLCCRPEHLEQAPKAEVKRRRWARRRAG